jgi:peptide-N4-(N-acetyl-beta-glucosaminyl)asparagine amidase
MRRFFAGFVIVCAFTSAASADLSYPDFSNPSGLALNSSAGIVSNKLRLTSNQLNQTGAAYGELRQRVRDGFTTTFQFQITGLTGDFPDDNGQVGGDGFSFIAQNAGSNALGGGGNALGYGGIANSVAIEFDTFWNTARIFPTGDPNGNHISIQTRGTQPNSADHSFSKGQIALVSPDLSDGAVHTAKIDYTPGQFKIFLDNLSTPILTANDASLDLTTLLALEGNSDAFVGFTAATGGGGQENHDVLSWYYTSVPEPASIAILLPGIALLARRRRFSVESRDVRGR